MMGSQRIRGILSVMEPGVEYSATELAYLTRDSPRSISGMMKILGDEGYVTVTRTTAEGQHGKYYRNTYRIKSEDPKNGS